MRLEEFNSKDEQLDELLGSIGKGVGKLAGGAAKSVGAVAGGIAGLGSAFKKGWQAGKTTVAGDDEPAGDSGGGAASSDSGGGSSAGGTAQGGGAAGSTGGTTSTGTAQGGAGGGAAQGGGDENADKVGALQARISKLDADSQKDIMQLLQKQAATAKPEPKPQATDKPADQAATTTDQAATTTDQPADQGNRGVEQPGKPTFTGVPEKPAADAEQPADQGGSKLSANVFGKMAQDLAGGAQKANDAGAQQTTQPAPQPDATEKPAPAAGNTAQRDLKAKLKAGGGLAKTSGGGFKQGMTKGNMRLGAGRGGVSMSHVPDGNPLIETKKFSLFRK